MKRVSSADLKAHLGEYLRVVQEGQGLYVTSHRKTVARLLPSSPNEVASIQPPSLPISVVKDLKGIRLSSRVDGVHALLDDRRRR